LLNFTVQTTKFGINGKNSGQSLGILEYEAVCHTTSLNFTLSN